MDCLLVLGAWILTLLINIIVDFLGGDEARPLEFPHQALIGYQITDDFKWICGGSLISPEFVLTGNKKWNSISSQSAIAANYNF